MAPSRLPRPGVAVLVAGALRKSALRPSARSTVGLAGALSLDITACFWAGGGGGGGTLALRTGNAFAFFSGIAAALGNGYCTWS